MRIYLDNNATTAPHPDVLDVLARSLTDAFGNPSSIHKEGQSARRLLEESRESVARLIGAEAREVVFTSGGTESNNAAIFGVAGERTRLHIVTTSIEHPAALAPVRELERRGASTTVVAPSRNGRVEAGAVIDAIGPDTKLVSVMLANNETGVVQPVEEIGRACRERGVHFHCDAVQGAGKMAIDVREIHCDTLSLSAHKLHAPKGIGALYVRRGLTLAPLLFGGAQERRRRAGTENAPLAAAFGAAAELARDESAWARMASLRDRLETSLPSPGVSIVVNGVDAPRLPNTSNLTFPGVDAESLVMALDLAGFAVSTGSACSSGRIEPSPVLLAMGLSSDDAKSTIRVSLSRLTTESEIDAFVAAAEEALGRCRR